ncbi:MAG: hypothetical protein AMXMBFR84_11880 [Candidatus Hydrogenedentota bacterium]
MKQFAFCACIAVAATWCALADTVHFKDGRTLEGITSQPNPNCVAISMGQSKVIFSMEDVDRIEKNDKTGEGYDLASVSPMAVQHLKMMEEMYGVSQEQREELLALLERLRSEDTNEHQVVMSQLATINGSVDVMRFLEAAMASFGKRLAPKALEAMATLNPERAKTTLRARTQDAVPETRAKAVELLAKVGDAESLELVARGMKDYDESVRIASANALAAMGDKRVTPVLIDGLSSTDARVVNASRQALTRLWGSAESPVAFEKTEEWQALWNGEQSKVANPIQVAQLQPLAELDPNAPEGYDHSE